jgi:long-subunit acyl-CoA synthetase (AMP-forming)
MATTPSSISPRLSIRHDSHQTAGAVRWRALAEYRSAARDRPHSEPQQNATWPTHAPRLPSLSTSASSSDINNGNFTASAARSLRAALTFFAERPLLGRFVRPQDVDKEHLLLNCECEIVKEDYADVGKLEFLSYGDVRRCAERLAVQLLRECRENEGQEDNQDQDQQHIIAIVSETSPDWVFADVATAIAPQLVLAPVHHWLPAVLLSQYLGRLKPAVILVSDQCRRSVEEAIRSQQQLESEESGPCILSLSELVGDAIIAGGASNSASPLLDPLSSDSDTPETLHTIVPTGGSTSVPKGVMFSSLDCASMLAEHPSEGEHVHVAYMPLSHITERHHVRTALWNGGRVAVLERDISAYVAALQSARPTVLVGVPRVWAMLKEHADALGGGRPGALHASIGGAVRAVISGSSPLDPRLLHWLQTEFSGAFVVHSYGAWACLCLF